MQIRLKLEDRILTATLIDSKTAQDFISLLPLTLTMNDLFRTEKFGHLPRAIPFVQDDWEWVDRAMQLRSDPFDHPTDNATVPLTRSKRWSAGAPAPNCLTNASRQAPFCRSSTTPSLNGNSLA
jgi:hypothetical protein